MLKALATLLRKTPVEPTPEVRPAPRPRPRPAPAPDENAPIYRALAMTEELRDALFPKTPQMMSAIFERPLPPLNRPPAAPPPPPPAGPDDGFFPIV